MNYLFKTRKLYGLHIFSSQFQVYSHWSKHSYLYGASSDPLRPHTVGKIFNDSVQQNPDRDFLISRHENIRCTYATMESEVDKVCKSFNAIELKRGDRLGIWLPNCALYFSLMYAAARLGIISVTINPAYQSDELKHSLTLSGVKCLVTMETFKTQNYPAIIEKIDPEILKRSPNTSIKSKVLPLLKTVVFYSENRINGAYNLKSFLDLGSNKSYVVPDVQPDDGCNIQFTSGTTGKPKAVLLSHFNLVNNIYFIVKRLELFDSDVLHTICCPTPLFHIFGISAGMLASILTKSTIYLPSAHYDPKTTADVITKEKCTFFFGTPTMYVDILSIFEKLQPEQRKDDMRLTIVGGAPCSPKLIHNFKKIFPGAKLMSVFGMTETSPCTFQNMPNDTDEQIMSTVGRIHDHVESVFGMTETSPITFQNYHDDTDEQIMSTVGQIHDHVEAKVVDLNGEMVPFGTPGELLIRGYVNMIGYYNDEEKTKETIDSTKWLKTGDQFMLYENGYGNVVGRTKDMIIRGGENIFPVEIELFLESHPLISNVYGIPDERMGEEVCASVILKEGAMFTEDEIRKYSKGKIAHFKIPKYIFIEQSEFPKTASGKVQKIKLKELAVQRLVKNENMN